MNLYSFHNKPESLFGFNSAHKVPSLSKYIRFAPKYQLEDVLYRSIDCIHGLAYSNYRDELEPEDQHYKPSAIDQDTWERMLKKPNSGQAFFSMLDSVLRKTLSTDHWLDRLSDFEHYGDNRSWLADPGSHAEMQEVPNYLGWLLHNADLPAFGANVEDRLEVIPSGKGYEVRLSVFPGDD